MNQLIPFVHHHWQLCLVFVVLLLITVIHEFIVSKQQAKNLSPQEAVSVINHEQAQVIDLRAADLFKKGHIIDSVRAAKTDFDLPKMNKYKNLPVILVCARGLESAAFAKQLKTKGFVNVQVLAGGINAWQLANLPLIKK